MRRLLMVVAAVTTVALPISVAVVVAAPAANAGVSLTCGKLKGSETGSVTASKCLVPKADKKTYKSLTALHASQLATGGTLTWSTSGKTTIVSAPTLSSPTGGCKAGKQTEELAVGHVVGGTSALTHAGDTFRAEVCITNKNGKIALVKGTSISL